MQQTNTGKTPVKSNTKTTSKLRGKNGFNYSPKWAVIIPCDSEETQQQTYAHLHDMGYKCKVVTV